MEIVFAAHPSMRVDKWLHILQEFLPQAHITTLENSSGNADYAVVWSPPAELFQRETRLKYMFNLGAGVDALVKMPELPPDLPIVRLEDGGMAAQMAEYVVYFLVQHSRNFLDYAKQQSQSYWHHLPSIKRREWHIGIMGAGRIGSKIAQACAVLDYPTAIWSRTDKDIEGVVSYAGDQQLDAFLQNTRVLVNVLPLTDKTRGILCAEHFAKLRPNAILINIARGGHLVEQDLLDSLASGVLDHAVLDVFNTEPLPAEHAFWQHPQITITPHASGASLLYETAQQITTKIKSLENGQAITGIVNKNQQY